MSEFKRYRRTQIAEMADWEPGFDMTGVSVSDVDKATGSPRLGDKIARNPANHQDRWLVAAAYFELNFEALGGERIAKLEAALQQAAEVLDGMTHCPICNPKSKPLAEHGKSCNVPKWLALAQAEKEKS